MQILFNLNFLSETLPLFLCLLFFKKNKSKEIKVFFIYKAFVTLLVIIAFATNFKFQNSIVSISVICEVIFLTTMYYYIIKSSAAKKLMVFGAVLFGIFWCYNFSRTQISKLDFDFIPSIIESLFFMAVIVYYFYEIMRYNYYTPLFELPSFWVSVAFLIFFSGDFFILLVAKTRFSEFGFGDQFVIVNSTLTIIKNILLCVAIFVNKNLVATKNINTIPSNLNLDTFQPLNKQANF